MAYLQPISYQKKFTDVSILGILCDWYCCFLCHTNHDKNLMFIMFHIAKKKGYHPHSFTIPWYYLLHSTSYLSTFYFLLVSPWFWIITPIFIGLIFQGMGTYRPIIHPKFIPCKRIYGRHVIPSMRRILTSRSHNQRVRPLPLPTRYFWHSKSQ